jgi:type IV secretion system protein VirB8
VRSDANGATQSPSPWVAVIRYRYSTAPMSVEDRYVNPLGFQVTSYRKDPEAVPPPAADQIAGALLTSGNGSVPASAQPTAPVQPSYRGPASSPPNGGAR